MDLKELFLKRESKTDENSEAKKKPDKSNWIVLILVGVLLLVIVMPTNNSKQTEEVDNSAKDTSQKENSNTNEESKTTVEEQLEKVLSQIEGAGKVKVMITYKDSGTQVVEKDTSINNDNTAEEDSSGGTRKSTSSQSGETTVYDNESKDGSPFISKELTPQIEGVLVVAEGGNKTSVRQNISNAVLALFPVEAHKIVVVKMND